MSNRLLPARLIGASSVPDVVSRASSRPTVQRLIDTARIRHWSFADAVLGDGAAVLFLNERQRTLLGSLGPDVEGMVGTSLQYTIALTATQKLVGLIGDVPVYGTTYQDGYAQHLTDDGVPYIDTAEAPIAGDPFGQHGGTPGFPLPADFVRFVNVGLVYGTDGRNVPCDVINERERYTAPPGRNPQAFIAGNRLVPVFRTAVADTGNRWFSATALQMSYIGMPLLTGLSDVVMLPALLCEALTADLASMFADQSKGCTPGERTAFAAKAAAASARLAGASIDMLDSVQSNRVHFLG